MTSILEISLDIKWERWTVEKNIPRFKEVEGAEN